MPRKSKENKRKKNVLDILIMYRFIIAIIVFIFLVAFKIHGSSIGIWDQYVGEKINSDEKTVLWGNDRSIRSDEWMVQSTYYMAQATSDDYYPLYNENIMDGGLNMILAYNSPVADITILGKPFNWGFLLLGKEYGLSWYWSFKTIALLLLSFELSMILTKKRKEISTLGAFWITFSPAIQWWFMQHVGDVIFFTLALIVSFYKYCEYRESTIKRLMFSGIFAFSAIGFALIIYPAFQVPMAYLILVLMAVIYFSIFKKPKLKVSDYFFIGAIIITIGGILGWFFVNSIDAIKASLNTVYPGKRVSVGGGIEIFRFGEFMINAYTPFKDINYINNCETSSFINFFIGASIVLFIAIKKKVKNISIGIALFVVSVIELIWTLIPFNEVIAKITLLSYVPTERMMLMFSFTAMLLSIWAMGVIVNEKIISKKNGCLIAIINWIVYCLLVYNSPYKDYVSIKYYILLFGIYLIINLALFTGLRRVLYLSMAIVIFMSGMTVNPIVKGVGAIYNKTLSKAIIEIETNDPDAIWIAEGDGVKGNYIYANGAKTLNGTHFYPAMKTWESISSDSEIYNRYAHVKINLVEEETKFKLDNLDAFSIDISIDELKKLNVKYILTRNELDTKFGDYNEMKFNKIYYSEVDNNKIYEIIYNQ